MRSRITLLLLCLTLPLTAACERAERPGADSAREVCDGAEVCEPRLSQTFSRPPDWALGLAGIWMIRWATRRHNRMGGGVREVRRRSRGRRRAGSG